MSVGIGIDIGASSVTVAGVRQRGGSLSLEYYRHYLLEELVGAQATPADIAVAVSAQLSAAGIKPRNVQLGVSGRDAIIRYSHLPPMPDWRLALLMEFEINDVAERTGEPLSADYHVLPGDDGNLVLVALAKDARVKEVVDAFEDARVEVAGAVPQPVATADCFRFLGDADSGITVVLDIGHASTEVSLVDEGELIFARSVALGGASFTERLVEKLGLSEEEADAIKTGGSQKPDVAKALTMPRLQLANMVKASVDFARKQLRRRNLKIDRAVVSGGSARVEGLVKAVSAALECPAELFDPLADLDRGGSDRESREAADEFGPEAVTALGLALGRIVPRATQLNLLPLSVKERLEFRHRTVWLYVAGAVLAASLLVSFLIGFVEYHGQSNRDAALTATNAEIGKRLSAHQERAASNDRRDDDLRALSDRARPGYHLAALLATLGEVMPPQISLVEASLVEDGDQGGFHFEFSGVADDGQGEGVSAMRALKLALEQQPLVASVSLVPEPASGSMAPFRMEVEPKGNPAPAEEGS